MATHQEWQAAGFQTLPIIPPLVALSDPHNTSLASQRGKVPGLRRPSGWHGYDWREEAAPAGRVMDEWGAGVGLPGAQWPAWDIDCRDPVVADLLGSIVIEGMGPAPMRIGQAPKRIYPYVMRAGEAVRKWRVRFWLPGDDREAPGAKPHVAEFLGTGQFWVADGTHSGTGRPYGWPEERQWGAWVEAGQVEVDRTADWILTALGTLDAEIVAKGGSGGDEDVDQAGLAAPDEEALAEALDYLQPDGSREWWVACGHAIKAAGGTLAQWEEVGARGGPIDEPGASERRWNGFGPRFQVGWPWIELRARGAGWLGSARRDFAGLDLAALAAEAGNSFPSGKGSGDETLQERMFARYVWVERLERVGDTETREILTRGQFNVRLADIGPPYDSRKSAWAVFTADKDRCRHVAGVTYRPGQGAIVREASGLCLNEWRDDGLQPAAGPVTDDDVRPYLELAERAYADPELRGWVLDFFSWVAQKPGEKPAFGLVMGGHQGIGKDTLLLPLARLIGHSNTRHITMKDVLSGQTWYLARTRLLVVQEVHSFTRIEVADHFKPLLASLPPFVVVNIKFVPQYEVPNLAACVMMTNRRDALAIDKDDRRHLVAWSSHPDINQLTAEERAASDAFFARLHRWLENGGCALVGRWMLQRDVSAFGRLTRAPWTEGKEEMRQAARGEVGEMVEEAVADWPDLVTPADLAARLSARGGRSGRPITVKAVAAELRALGAEPISNGPVVVPQTATVAGSAKVRIWTLRNRDAYIGMQDAALGRKFGEMWGATQQDLENTFSPKMRGTL